MDNLKAFKLKIPDINPDKLTELQGVHGPFYISPIGGKPEMQNGFFYGDSRYQFCFYADVEMGSIKSEYSIDVNYATGQRFVGTVVIEKKDVRYIEQNITKLFQSRAFFFIDEPVSPSDIPKEIRFTWQFA